MLTIDPRPRSAIAGPNAWAHKNAPVSPTDNSVCHRSRLNVSSRSPSASPVESTGASMAALLTSTSTASPSSASRAASVWRARGSVMSTCS